jgi:hypothetical protein
MYAAQRAAEALSRGDEAQVRYWQRITAKVDEAPPLETATRDRLKVLLRSDHAAPLVTGRPSETAPRRLAA